MKRYPQSPRRTRGMTLIEQLVSMSIAAIMLTLGTPSFVSLIERNRASSAANDLLRALMTARAHALATGDRVVLAPMVDNGDWHDGWRVFLDTDNNASMGAAPDELVRSFAALPANVLLTANSNYGDSGKRFVSFTPLGYPRTLAGAFPGNGQFVIQSGSTQRAVCFDITGRAWIAQSNTCS